MAQKKKKKIAPRKQQRSLTDRSNKLVVISAVITVFVFLTLLVMISRKTGRQIPQTTPAILFFSDINGDFLVEEDREIPYSEDPEELCRDLVAELASGSKVDLEATLPEGAQLIGLSIDKAGVAYLNLSSEFAQKHSGGSSGEVLAIFSIVNTLAHNVPAVKMVQFLIEGKEQKTLAGHIMIDLPLPPKYDLVKD